MTREEWIKRYAARIKEIADITDAHALECAEVGAEENFRNNGDVWLDPEDDADVDLSYWEDDGCDE